jgi:hypothetical protein
MNGDQHFPAFAHSRYFTTLGGTKDFKIFDVILTYEYAGIPVPAAMRFKNISQAKKNRPFLGGGVKTSRGGTDEGQKSEGTNLVPNSRIDG